jgi:hypothetical protein
LKEEVQDRSLWRTRFGKGYEPVARHATTWLELIVSPKTSDE